MISAGLAVSYYIVPAWVGPTGAGLPSFLLMEALLQSAMTLLTIVLWVPDERAPGYQPPNLTDTMTIADLLRKCWADRSFVLLAVAYGCHVGALFCFQTYVRKYVYI
jgi:hypothetical protein